MVLDKFILISIPIILLVNFFLIKNYNLFFLKKTKDKEFSKPQAFHARSVPRIGGFLIFIFLIMFSLIFFHKFFFFTKYYF
jgi:UDP-N-acetylmuramyl pentapeptide phosphotransferase/UDP-N-acetylglucosamine-1-phosphate transferase